MSRKLAEEFRRARIQRRVEAGEDPELITKEEASFILSEDQVLPKDAQLFSIYDFASEAEENGRIFELYEKQVGVGVLSNMSNEQIASTIRAPSTGLPISTARFVDIFQDHLEHADAAIVMRNNAELVQSGITGEKGDRVRAQVFIAERKGGFIQRKETKTEVTLQAKVEIEERVSVTRTNVFAALDKLSEQLRDSGKVIDGTSFLRDAEAEKALVPSITGFDQVSKETKPPLVDRQSSLPPLPKKKKWDDESR